jgi:BASS family bile acid:Na+ symporter
MIKFIKNWTLPIAMLVGASAYPLLIHIRFLMPYLLFLILLITFTKVSFKDLRYEPLHGWLLIIQLVGSVLLFALIYPFSKYIAESVMLCLIAPTAAAAAVVTGKLGGSVPCLTMYTLLSSVLTAVMVPLFFPIVATLPPDIDVHVNSNFFLSVLLILSKVFPIIILPLILAWLIRRFIPRLHQQMLKVTGASFYLWGCSLTIVTAVTVDTLVKNEDKGAIELLAALAGLAACLLQFYIGKRLGSRYNQRISGGQGLGQKNTVLIIWISQVYLNPVASLAPCSYVIWQNIINSWQLWKKRKKEAEGK